MSWLNTFEGSGDPPPMQYHSGPDTLLWTRLGQTCWEREDGVKVLQHWSPPGKGPWAVDDHCVRANTGWYQSKFDAMNAADIVLPARHVPKGAEAERMRAIEKRLDAAESRIAELEDRNRPEPPRSRYRNG